LIYGAVDRTGLPKTGVCLSNVTIKGNTCSNIYVEGNDGVSEVAGVSGIVVDGNFLTYTSYTAPSGIDFYIAIRGVGSGSVQIINNKIYSPPATLYERGIQTDMNDSIINGNVIDGFSLYGIYISNSSKAIISNNKIYRRSEEVTNYIRTVDECIISNNYLDSTTVDGATPGNWEDSIVGTSAMTDNINHIRQFNLRPAHGAIAYEDEVWYFHNVAQPITFSKSQSNNYYNTLTINGATNSVVYWRIPLRGLLPDHASVIDATITASTDASLTRQGDLWIGYTHGTVDVDSLTGPIDFAGSTVPQTDTMPLNPSYSIVGSNDLEIYVKAQLETMSVVHIDIRVYLRWYVK